MSTVAYVENQKQETICFGAKEKHENNGESKQSQNYEKECNRWIQNTNLKIR